MSFKVHNNLITLWYVPYYQEEIFQTYTQRCSTEFVAKEGGKETQNKASNTNGTLILKKTISSHVQDEILERHTNTIPTDGTLL